MSLKLSYESYDDAIEKLIYSMTHVVSLKDSKDKECVVCGEIQNQWECYQLPCQHYGHSRCLRKWFNTKKSIWCPLCGDETPQRKYCYHCRSWGGHSALEESLCPQL